jgi:DNA-binding response OmpR family regulator
MSGLGRRADRPGTRDPKAHICSLLHISFGTKSPLQRDVLVACVVGAWVENLLIILVVEDEQLLQSIVEESLTDGGFETVIASSGENAVELLDASEGKFRALVTDINLGSGKIDGWNVAQHAREIDANFPIVYMSGKDADDWASKGVPNSIMLAKPFAPAQLVTAVSQLLNASPPAAPTA